MPPPLYNVNYVDMFRPQVDDLNALAGFDEVEVQQRTNSVLLHWCESGIPPGARRHLGSRYARRDPTRALAWYARRIAILQLTHMKWPDVKWWW